MHKPAVKPIRTVMMSLWRDDMQRNLSARIDHLLHKVGVDRWVWVVGNCSDSTEAALRSVAHTWSRITVVRFDSEELGNTPEQRLVRLSQTAQAGMDTVQPDDDYWVVHESDLQSPINIVPQLLTMQSHPCAAAGWVTLGDLFYDSWCYRGLDGVKFTNHAPYHTDYKPDQIFEVSSAGSVLLFPAEVIRKGASMTVGGLAEFCGKLRAMGYPIYVSPNLKIEQPMDLWSSSVHPSY